MPRGGFGSFSPDDKKLAYNRIFREFRTWKRYRGGMADDIWIYDFDGKTVENITDNPALDIIPMWSGDRIYFVSDRDENKKMNLYVYDLGTKETRKLTDFTEYDIKFPSLGPNAIVFENGGNIHRFDLASEKAVKVPVVIAEDMAASRTKVVPVSGRVNQYEIAPDGKRALFGARGDIFTVPAKFGNTRNLTRTPGVHERAAKWSPDGKWIAYISDASGTDEIWLAGQDGTGTPRQLTKNGDTYKYRLAWSPDSKKILWDDKKQRLSTVDVATGEVVEVVRAVRWEVGQSAWSPDGKWIAYDKPEVDEMNRIYLYSVDSKKTFEVTDGWYNSGGPSFSTDGKYLFFVSDRDFDPVYSATEWNHAYLAMSRVFFVTLARETKSPFEPKSDEVAIKKEEEKPAPAGRKDVKKDDKDAEAAKAVVVKVDPEGLKDRIIALPIETSNYGNVMAVGRLRLLPEVPRPGSPPGPHALRSRGEEGKGPRPGPRLRDIGRPEEDARRPGRGVRHPRPAQGHDQDRPEARPLRPGGHARPPGGMEPDLRRVLAPDEGLLLRSRHARRRLAGHEGALRARSPPRSDHRADLTYVIGEMIGELIDRPHVRRRRRDARAAEGQGRNARRPVRARREDRLSTGSRRSSRARTGTGA